MPKVSLSGMTVEALMDLRKRVDEMLHRHRAELQKQLERMGRQLPWSAAEGLSGAVKAHYGEGKSHQNIEVRQARLGQVVGQSQGGLLLRSKVERNSTIF